MIFSKYNVDDIKKYYLGSVVKFPATGDRLMKIINVNSEEVTCMDVDGFEISIDLSEEYEVEYPIPGRTVYQQGQQAVMLVRRPAKQYYRGIHEQNTQLLTLYATGKWGIIDVSINNLQQFVDKPCYQDPNLILESPYNSFALNKYTAVTKHGDIFILMKNVGMVDFEKKQVITHAPIFKTEIADAFPSWEFV